MKARRLSHVQASLTLAITAKSKALKAQGIEVINFGAGEPDFNTPQEIVDAAKSALDAGQTKYTAVAGTPELREAIASWYTKEYGVPTTSEEVIVGVGGKQVLYNACMALLNEGDKVLLPAPYWLSYPAQILLSGAEPVFVECREENDFLLSPAQLKEEILKHQPKMLILNSPSNPTGQAYDEKQLMGLIEVLREFPDLLILWDPIYAKLVYDGFVHRELTQLAPDLKNRVIIAHGFSKTFAMTGWRIGFGIASIPIIKAMTTIQSHSTSNPTSFAQAGAVAALKLKGEFFEKMSKTFTQRRKTLVESINAAPHLSCVAPKGTFYTLVNVKAYLGKSFNGQKISDDIQLAEYLIDSGRVATVPASAFGAPGYLRLSFAIDDASIRKGIDMMVQALQKLE